MSEINFPTGPWRGFYNYQAGGNKHRMDLILTFSKSSISGSGSDDVGKFEINGTFDAASGECFWKKTYLRAHTVHYRGFREGKGIWGVWKLSFYSGGFHIWPVGNEDERKSLKEKERPPEKLVQRAIRCGGIRHVTPMRKRPDFQNNKANNKNERKPYENHTR